ncbi:MAG: polysaccharide pyruvyl transferase family protein [Parcubacteria group bacterium]|jgi:polysaccharide pyruvyl transferase WcaK-like protein
MKKNKEKAVLILGSYGHTNIGDDLLMYNYVFLFRNLGFKKIYTNVAVSANVPEEIAKVVHMKETYGTSFLDWLKILKEVDVVCYGGGTILKELYSSTSRSRYAVIIRMMFFNFFAKVVGKTIYNLNIGIGSLQTIVGKLIVKISLIFCDFTIFRDADSYNFAKDELKINIKKIGLGEDGLFINEKWHDHRAENLPMNVPNRVGVNVLFNIPDWVDRESYLKELRDFVNNILERGFFVVFIPFQHLLDKNNDLVFIERDILPYLKNKNYELIHHVQIDKLAETLKGLDFFVGMRFHSLLMAISTATPFLAIEYDTKCSRIIKEYSYPYSVQIENFSCDLLVKNFDALISNREKNIDFLIELGNRLYAKEFQCEKDLWKKLEK